MSPEIKSKPISGLKYIQWDPDTIIYKFTQGNETCAEAALLAGLDFYGGYPITPSSEIAEVLSLRMPQEGKVFIQLEDEIASMASIIGASLGGSASMTATSGPGFSLMQENLGYAVVAEVPCVLVNVQRMGPSTGDPTAPAQGDVMQAKWGTHGDHPMLTLCPSSIQEVLELTVVAFDFAERFRTPVILLLDEIVAHMREKVAFPSEDDVIVFKRNESLGKTGEKYLPYDMKTENDVPPLVSFGRGARYHVTGLIHDEAGFPTRDRKQIKDWYDRIYNKFEKGKNRILLYDVYNMRDADTVIISYGVSARVGMEAMVRARKLGKKVGMLKLLTIWPLAEEVITEILNNVKKVVVPEMNRGQLIMEIERLNRANCQVIGVNQYDGEIVKPGDILKLL
jgi:2-oxoglutarate/2-oxoacid ferredoxin oxidoreductase subunit alpha